MEETMSEMISEAAAFDLPENAIWKRKAELSAQLVKVFYGHTLFQEYVRSVATAPLFLFLGGVPWHKDRPEGQKDMYVYLKKPLPEGWKIPEVIGLVTVETMAAGLTG